MLVAAVIGACGCADPAARTGPPPASSPASPASSARTAAAPQESASPSRAAGLPAPDEEVPRDPVRLAEALHSTTRALREAVDAWTRSGGAARGRPPETVELQALYQQRIYRYAARHRDLADRAFAKLPKALAAEARDNTRAIRELLALAVPLKGKATFVVKPPLPADVLLGHFKRAERRFGVEWELLAAVMFVETKFGRVRSKSHAGAQGPMQFMPATWRAYGLGGDVHDVRDAVMGAANYLRASGAPGDRRRALHAYNPSNAYVDAVSLHARQIERDPRNFYAYYNWQVFVITTTGERRLSGPT
ncbi:lytic transglycosylase domain-containing protein [Sphaerisporangium sp. B11E5]